MFTSFGDFFSSKGGDAKNTASLWLVKWFSWIQNNCDDVKRNREKQTQVAKQQGLPEQQGYFMQMFAEQQQVNVIDITPEQPAIEGIRYA